MTTHFATAVTVVPPGSGDEVHIPGIGAVFKIRSADTGGEVAIVEQPFAVGAITAPHLHTREDEHSIVVEGKIGVRSDDSEVVLGPGGYITKPRGQMHAMWNAGNVPARTVEIITPGGFETYLLELGELLAPRVPKSRDEAGTPTSSLHRTTAFADLAAKYGLTYGEPDWLTDVVDRFHLRPPTH